MITRRRFMSGSAAGIAFAAARPPSASLAQQSRIKIGLLLPFTGQFNFPATQLDDGIKLYLKQYGDSVAGKKVEVIRRDTTGAPEVTKRLAEELLANDQVDILAGFLLTPEALAAADLSATAKRLMVVMNAAASIVTTKSPYIIRSSNTIAQICEPLANWAFDSGVRRVFTLVADYGPGQDAESSFRNAFVRAGGQIVGSVRTPLANQDFSSYVLRAMDAHPDGIFEYVPGGTQPALLAKAFVEQGIDPTKVKIMGGGELTYEAPLAKFGDLAIGVITAFHYDYTHESAVNSAFVKAYNAEFGRNPDNVSVGGFDGMHLIYEALKATKGNPDADSLVAVARDLKWESPRGPISIDPNTRDVINTIYIRRVEKIRGRLQNEEIAKFENVKDPQKSHTN